MPASLRSTAARRLATSGIASRGISERTAAICSVVSRFQSFRSAQRPLRAAAEASPWRSCNCATLLPSSAMAGSGSGRPSPVLPQCAFCAAVTFLSSASTRPVTLFISAGNVLKCRFRADHPLAQAVHGLLHSEQLRNGTSLRLKLRVEPPCAGADESDRREIARRLTRSPWCAVWTILVCSFELLLRVIISVPPLWESAADLPMRRMFVKDCECWGWCRFSFTSGGLETLQCGKSPP